ncbi:MAG: helicase-related protein, partial [Hyphomonadaceae bacterium]
MRQSRVRTPHGVWTACKRRRARHIKDEPDSTGEDLTARPESRSEAPVVAVLGPTNTGKTHLAIERMLAHADGMIGLPLRLLAREVYDKVVAAKGAHAAALITGEERIAPPTARYFICTAEAMPLDRRCAFLAVDEIQLATDPDRGHVFTDRILHARGLGETMLLGSDVVRPLVRRLLPEARIERRERFSTLSYVGPRKITKLPKRTAIVAFSAEEVYAIAEVIRRQRGGAAVVMGALSPRTRNAQAALYQSGEVDFLVATDAIGMGLNLDVDHVAFAAQAKFDGRRHRALRADEIAQIAGRAGRFRNEGTFGETGDCPQFDEEAVARVENHEFEPVFSVEWRNRDLDFRSIAVLQQSLQRPPDRPGLLRVRGAEDEEVLKRLALDPDIEARAATPAAVRLLWDICQVPDYRKVTVDEHARLLGAFARHLLERGRLPADWVAREVGRLDRIEGDLDALQARLAHIRTWTYAAHHADWIEDAAHWVERTRAIEEMLSDALHALLTQRFIDRRTSALLRRLKDDDGLLAGVAAEGEVTVEGHYVGRLQGLQFKPDPRAAGREGRAVRNAAMKALGPEVLRRLAAITAAADFAFSLDGAAVRYENAAIARISPGAALLRPQIDLVGAEAADPMARRRATVRLEAWVGAQIARDLAPL